MSKIETICATIAVRRQLQICCRSNYRAVEPDGYRADAIGHPAMVAWQLEGGGSWDNGDGWRLLAAFADPRPRHDGALELPAVYVHA